MKKKDFAVIPIYIITVFLPLVVYFTFQSAEFSQYPWFPNQDVWLDVFLYGKSCLFTGISLIMACCLAYQLIKTKNKQTVKAFLLPGIMALLLIFSAVFSEYREYSLKGNIGQYESVWVLLSYLVTGCYCYWYIKERGNIQKIGGALLIGAVIPCLLGVTQLLQCDFWSSSLGRWLMVPESMAQLRESLRFNFSTDEWGRVYMSLYNPNYAAVFLVMLLPVMFLWGKKKTVFLGGVALCCLAGTFSKTAWLAAVILILILAGCFREALGKKKNIFRISAGLFLISAIAGIAWTQLRGTETEETAGVLQEVVPGEDAVEIVYNDITVYLRDIRVENGNVKHDVRYEDGTKVVLDWSEERGECDPVDEKLQGLHFKVYEKDQIVYAAFRYRDIMFRFSRSLGTGKYEYITINGKVDELGKASSVSVLPEYLLSGRGYIWNRTLPLIGQNFLLGTGPDTFMLTFPQDDYVARSNLGYGFFSEVLTNAHSLYLQMAAQTGVPFLLCFLLMAGWYLRKSWKLYFRRKGYMQEERLGLALFLGVLGYLICGLTWASSICTSPVFWVLLGSGMAVNENISMRKKNIQ